MTKREEIVNNIKAIPPMPVTVSQLLPLLNNTDVNIAYIEKTIQYDQGITANVLKLANSAYYGFPRSIGSVREAVIWLGTNEIIQLVIAVSLSPAMKMKIRGYDLPAGELWRHSIAVAIAAEKLSSILKTKTPDFTFTTALLHDIGKIAIGEYVDSNFEEIDKIVLKKRESFEIAEREILGIDHAELGEAVLDGWHFPRELCSAVKYHHSPENTKDGQGMVDLVHIADALCLMGGIGTGREGLQYHPSKEVVSRLGIKVSMLELVLSQTMEEIDDLQMILESG